MKIYGKASQRRWLKLLRGGAALERRRGGLVDVGVTVRQVLADLALREIDPDYLEAGHDR